MYGIQDPETGQVSPANKGLMFGSVGVFLFILSIGGFMGVVFATGALDLGIHHLSHRFRERGALLIAVLMLLFGALGSIKGWSDETLGLYAMMVPLMIALGYDRIVTVAVVTVAPFVGALASTINPFLTGIGSSKAGVTIADGMGLRLVLLALSIAATIGYTLWYAGRVKADPSKSLCGANRAEDRALAAADAKAPEPLTTTHAIVIGLVFFTFGLLAFSIVPWGALLDNAPVDPYTDKTVNSPLWWELGWWLPELSALFFVMAIVVGIAGRLGEEATAKAFIKGVIDFTGPAFLVTLARSVSVVMTNTKTIDTVLHAMEGLLTGASSATFVMLTFLGSLPLSFLVGGGAAGTALTMPVLAPLGDFAGVDRAHGDHDLGRRRRLVTADLAHQRDSGRRTCSGERPLRPVCRVHRSVDGRLAGRDSRGASVERGLAGGDINNAFVSKTQARFFQQNRSISGWLSSTISTLIPLSRRPAPFLDKAGNTVGANNTIGWIENMPFDKIQQTRSTFGRSDSIESKMNIDEPSLPSRVIPIVGS